MAIDNQQLTKFVKKFQKKVLKKFANQEKSRTFVSGMRKQGSLDGIILLVISFSVINYVVSESVRLRQADSLFFYAPADRVFYRLLSASYTFWTGNPTTLK